MSNLRNKVYLVWQDGEDEQYWNQYDSLENAVSESSETEVFVARPKFLGRFKNKAVLIGLKKRKTAKRK